MDRHRAEFARQWQKLLLLLNQVIQTPRAHLGYKQHRQYLRQFESAVFALTSRARYQHTLTHWPHLGYCWLTQINNSHHRPHQAHQWISNYQEA